MLFSNTSKNQKQQITPNPIFPPIFLKKQIAHINPILA